MTSRPEGSRVVGGPLVAVLDYGIGNLRSAQKGLQRAGADARLTADTGLIADAAAVVLPGVGAFGRCMEALHRSGLAEVAVEAAASGRPFLGICVGMQLMYEASEETPGAAGLGIQEGVVCRLPAGVKHPQMQWNVLERTGPSRLLDRLDEPAWVYFVHSFAAPAGPDTIATCDYGGAVPAAIERGSIAATQFHPEKSGEVGLGILSTWVDGVTASVAA